MTALGEFVGKIEFGSPLEWSGLTMVPVTGAAREAEPGYLLFQEAAERGLTRVTELGTGVVPEVSFENLAERPVLILGGEELVGAKQNRMVNLTILVPARSRIVIPVSCVEAGRWHHVSAEFVPADHVAFRRVRASSTADVTASMRQHGARRTRQALVWEEIAACAADLDAHSSTDAMHAIFDRRREEVEEFVSAMPWCEGQVGAAFLIAGQPVGMDVFDHPGTMAKLLARLVRSYAVDALAGQRSRKRAAPAQAEQQPKVSAQEIMERLRRWRSELQQAEASVEPAVGMGQDFRSESSAATAAALWVEDRFVHFCAFPREADRRERGNAGHGALADPAWRRRHIRRRGQSRRPDGGHDA